MEDEYEEEHQYYTCAFCESTVIEYDATAHVCPVLENQIYSTVHVDKYGRFYPVLENSRLMLVPAVVDGNVVVVKTDRQEFDSRLLIDEARQAANKNEKKEPPSSKSKSGKKRKSSQLDDDEVEILIAEVEKRPPLWNYIIPLEQRTKQIKDGLYEEVSQILNGKLNAHEVQLKFKSLKDTFRKIVLHEQQASGSARLDGRPKWKYYQVLNFLHNSCLVQNNTKSNVPVPQPPVDDSMDGLPREEPDEHQLGYGSDNESTSLNSNQQHKRRRSSKSTSSNPEESRSALQKIADFICQPEPPLQLATPPIQPDELDLLMNSALLQLRKLPYEIRMDLAMKFTETVHRTVVQHMKKNSTS